MKHKKIISLCSISLLVSAAVSGAVFSSRVVEHAPVKATIDINDYTACNEKYESKDASGLLSALRTITSPGSAGSYSQLWTTYKKCYVRADGKMFDYYSSRTNYRPGTDQAGNYSKEGDCYNREHSIPKSWWGGAESNQGADPYIVVPTDAYVNNGRDNYPFGMVKTASVTYSNSKKGTSDPTWGYSGIVFEPDDSVKGDFARIYFYAIAKYSGSYGWTKDKGTACFSGSSSTYFGLTPYTIKLMSYWSHLDPVSDWEKSVNNKVSVYQKNRNPFIDHPEYADVLWGNYAEYTPYIQTTGVTLSSKTLEIKTNNSKVLVANSSNQSGISWTVSNPSVVSISKTSSSSGEVINVTGLEVGTAVVTASAVIDGETYSSSCAITVTQSTDPTVHVTSVNFVKKELTLHIGDVTALKYVINPSNAGNKTVYFNSEDPYIAYFKDSRNPTIVAYGEGKVVMTITTDDGGLTDTCVVTVKKAEASKGCGGNIVTTSVVLSTLSILGIGLLLIKRYQKSK